MNESTQTLSFDKLGFHYYPDSLHYTESDLRTWLIELKALGAAWLVLMAPPDRAIPEPFIAGLIREGIEPILHFAFPLIDPPKPESVQLLFSSYARWGVRYAALFDRPNTRLAWGATSWAHADLVERFLDIYIPLADMAQQSGLTPVFPPLEPGGDYWDLSFLSAALKGIQRRGYSQLQNALVLAAYAGVEERPLSWGAGGPERWPGARPYFTPPGQEDQRGFYIFDWYQAVAQAVCRTSPDILLFAAGSRLRENGEDELPFANYHAHMHENLALARLVVGNADLNREEENLDPISPRVRACCFWLLASSADAPQVSQAWFQPDGSALPIIGALRQLVKQTAPPAEPAPAPMPPLETPPPAPAHLIDHYLLLPLYEWGVVEWHLDVIRPYLLRHHPTLGFSLAEAALAKRVTILGGEQIFPEDELDKLRHAGCEVERVTGDGTSIATQMEVL
jgi:hypothetical protein